MLVRDLTSKLAGLDPDAQVTGVEITIQISPGETREIYLDESVRVVDGEPEVLP